MHPAEQCAEPPGLGGAEFGALAVAFTLRAVGDATKKMASCLGCTLFMHAAGYPPTSIHLGSAESWAPLYTPYNPNGPTGDNELGVIRDLNNAWYAKCAKWLELGLEIAVLLVAAGSSLWLMNLLMRVGISGDRERDAEEEARAYFDEHGVWPDEDRARRP